MTPAPAPRATAEAITAVIADRVRELREQAGMSQDGLAQEMKKLGIPWKRATVVNLEKRGSRSRGQAVGRDAVTVQELLGLALVLDAAPATLLADPRRQDKVDVGNVKFNQWQVLGWLIGKTHLFAGDPPNDDVPDSNRWEASFALIRAAEDFWAAQGELGLPDAVDLLGEDAVNLPQAQADIERRRRDALDVITRVNEEMRKARAKMPPLPDTVQDEGSD